MRDIICYTFSQAIQVTGGEGLLGTAMTHIHGHLLK